MPTATKAKATKKSAIRLQPLNDRIVVLRESAEERTAGGIVLPDAAKNKPSRGEVVSVGAGRMLEDGSRCPPQVQVGDRVLFTAYGGENITVDDEEYLLLREDDVLAVIEGE